MPASDDPIHDVAAGPGAAVDGLVEGFARELERLAPKAERLLVALSGGADSMAALRLALAAGARPVAAHFDHRLRPESADDAAFVRESCAALGVELLEGGADVAAVARERGWNLEDAARRLRYGFLHRALASLGEGPGVIVVAHTLEDQAETVLLQLLRGAAFPGGMRARNRAVIRPLLGVHRAELRRYLLGLGQVWREDASNLDVSRNRAWVRHELLPMLERRFPGAARRLAGTSQQQREAREALETLATRRFPEPTVRLAALRSAPAALRKSALAARVAAAGSRPSKRLLDELDAAVTGAGAPGPWRIQLPNGAEARVAYGELEIVVPGPAAAAPEPVRVRSAEQLPPGVDPALVTTRPGLELRARRPGDRIRLPAGTKLVSDLLVDRKVPREERDRLRLLADGSEVLWVEGVAAAPGVLLAGLEGALWDGDRRHMRWALDQARRALELGEVPIGAAVVRGGEVLAAGHNLTEASGDPTAHAEMVAIRRAADALGDWRLAGATLYVTLEPCPMCFGAVLQTQLARVVFGADNLRDGALGGVTDLRGEGWKRLPEVRGGVEAPQAAKLLRDGFAARRRP